MKLFTKLTFCIALTFFSVSLSSAQADSTKVKFTYRPKPAYTDSARKNQISGDVFLKVEFKADGKIGEITVDETKTQKKMKNYGLVKKAIEAAKGIKFIPATEDGKSVTVSSTVIMSFLIY